MYHFNFVLLPEMTRKKRLLPSHILEAVCLEYQHVKDDVLGVSRKKSLSEARKVAAYLIRCNSSMTLQEVASYFNRKDHTTAIFWIAWARSQRENRWFERVIGMIYARLKQLDPTLILAW